MVTDKARLAWEQWGKRCFQIIQADLNKDTYEVIQITHKLSESANLTRYMKAVDISEFLDECQGKETFQMVFRDKTDRQERKVRVEVLAAEDYAPEHRNVYIFFVDEGICKDSQKALVGEQNAGYDIADAILADIRNENSGKKILVVEDDKDSRQQLERILSLHYQVQTAKNGVEAWDILTSDYSEIVLVITDLYMPVMGGNVLVERMKKEPLYQNIPIIITTESVSGDTAMIDSVGIRCLELGATDFVLRPYNPRIILNRVKSIMRLQESVALLKALETDPITGLLTKEFFFKRVEEYLKSHPEDDMVMWASDIIGLKVINEKYGIEMGDRVISCQAHDRHRYPGFVFGGRIEGDKFAALITAEALPKIREITKRHDMGIDFPIPNVVIKHGFYHIRKETTLRPQGMYDRALLALQKIKDNYGVYSFEYDDVLRKDLLRQRLVAENAETALKERQFMVYYQPKYDLHMGRTNGAEALIRWVHPELGFMNPGVFIPIFEQNGFIRKLDWYVWEEVCTTLEEWQKAGKKMVPVSVNVSRRDFEDEDLAKKVIDIVDRHGIEHSYFHIEVTESAYSDNPERITSIIRQFHESGFIIELDDFGAGYSSMTALSDLDLDIMKLDMSIIRKDDPGAERNVLELSMELARMMNLRTVAEGVETQGQAERVMSLGGDYIQGYYYSKPLPKSEFEAYLAKENAE